MAAASRYGSIVLSRAASTQRIAPVTIRAFSTSFPLRDEASRPIRSNPLIGNYKQKPAVDAESSPKPTLKNTPPPPPPPPSSTSPAADARTGVPKPDAKDHPYNAGKRAQPGPSSSTIDIASIIGGRLAGAEDAANKANTPPPLRTKPVLGRTVFVKSSHYSSTTAPTAPGALIALNRLVGLEKLRVKSREQKFHERKGLKKKRLRSERWRARFKTGFKAAVKRVMELKKQGW
ncbi:hypothetical protein B0I35DRAFT_424902 [Stachybotrys elegans]|uniref:Ribosomal protein S21 n=1 Tax=Stachybotrys elegans TaxID=80388 RepID=A0A8K0SWM6_9HYPO|nr:hypothetical protein B0I35DRAFT_424902 [Stachybotrys elegans]